MALNFPSDTTSPYTDPTSGVKYIFNDAIGAWEAAIQPPAIVSATQPNIAIEGFMWWNSTSNILYVYENGQWIATSAGAGSSTTVTISPTEPSGATASDLWWDNEDGRLFIYYTDADSSQWIDTSPNVTGTNRGVASVSSAAPSVAVQGDIWYNTLTDAINIYDGIQWIVPQTDITGISSLTSNSPLIQTGTAADPILSITSSSTSSEGTIRTGTQSEVNAGILTNVAITPGTLSNAINNYLPVADETTAGIVELATSAEVITGTATDRAITPAALNSASSQLGLGNPPGTIITFAGNTAPTGYLACNGAAVDRVTYADLFAVCGTLYGSGDGSTTFNLPDLRGEFVRGWDDGRSIDSGRVFGSTQNSANKSHTHNITDPGHTHNITAISDDDRTVAAGSESGGNAVSSGVTDTGVTGITIDNDGLTEARPRNIALLYCIKS